MLIKLGVNISLLDRNMRRKLNVIDDFYTKNTNYEAVVTSTYEGSHSPGSLHYCHQAIDIRKPAYIANIPLPVVDFVAQLAQILGEDFDVVLESDHIHIEYDPK